MDIIAAFQLPFLQKALLAGLALGLILPFLGVFVTLRKMSFFGEGIAHASLTGVALGVLTGMDPFLSAVGVGVLVGIMIYLLERKTLIAPDALIGVLFATALAIGLILLSLHRGYQPELISFLFGNILTINSYDLIVITIFSALIFIVLIVFRRQLTMLALDKESAWLSGIRTEAFDFFFYIILSVTIVLGIKLLGIILVSALLVIPPSTAKLLAPSLHGMIVGSMCAGILAVVAGLAVSYLLDLPTGAVIVLCAAVFFFGSLALRVLKKSS
ncbi:metal ABC transporter permease [Candidatus Uhrbacteria bacterium]|nr:metal ABC transporter permease [Candidatus Uhrbacteria bacterium]